MVGNTNPLNLSLVTDLGAMCDKALTLHVHAWGLEKIEYVSEHFQWIQLIGKLANFNC